MLSTSLSSGKNSAKKTMSAKRASTGLVSAPLFHGPSLGLSLSDKFGPDLCLTRASFIHLSSLRLVPSGQSRQNRKTFATHIHANVIDISILSSETDLHRFRTSKPPTSMAHTYESAKNSNHKASEAKFRKSAVKKGIPLSKTEKQPQIQVFSSRQHNFRRKDFAGVYIYLCMCKYHACM